MHIRRIRLENWRTFRRVDITCGRTVFLAGPASAGKSHFLDALLLLKDIADSGLQKAVATRGGVSRVRCLSARQPAYVTLEVDLSIEQTTGEGTEWGYRLSFTHDENNRPLIVSEKVWQGTNTVLERPGPVDQKDPRQLSQTALEQAALNSAFRTLPEALQSIQVKDPLPQLLKGSERSRFYPVAIDTYGENLLDEILAAPERTRNARLNAMSDALRTLLPHLHELQIVRRSNGQPRILAHFKQWRLHDAQQNQTQLSDGVLRLIALFWYLQDGDGPLLIEEPERSLNPGIIRQLAPLIMRLQKRRGREPRQLFGTTHSPALLSNPKLNVDQIKLFIPDNEKTDVIAASTARDARDLLEAELDFTASEGSAESGDKTDQLDVPF